MPTEGLAGNHGQYDPFKEQQGLERSKIKAQLQIAAMQSGLQWGQFNTQQAAQQASAQQASGGLGSMVDEYNKAYSQAKSDYEGRYQQMLGIANQTTNQRAADINSAYGRQSADTMQNLARLGMANTTVSPTMQTGIQREQQSSLNRLADEMQKTKLGIIGGHLTDQQLAPSTSLIQSAMAQGQQAAGIYGGGLTRALAAMKY